MEESLKEQYRSDMLSGIKREAHKELQDLMRLIVRRHVYEPTGSQDIYKLFSQVFDDAFRDIYDKKVDLKRKTRHMLEMLSISHNHKPHDERMQLYTDIIENKTYYQRKKKPENPQSEEKTLNS